MFAVKGRSSLLALGAVAISLSGCATRVDTSKIVPPPPSMMAEISAAKRVFVLNQGESQGFQGDVPGSGDSCYNEFYAALKATSRFELVGDPKKADLIFKIYGTEQDQDVSHTGPGIKERDYTVTNYPPLVHLDVTEPNGYVTLFRLVWPAGRAWSIPAGRIAFANSIQAMTAKVMLLFTGQTIPPVSATTLMVAVGPAPTPIVQAKTVYATIYADASAPFDYKGDQNALYATDVVAAMNAWGRFTLVKSAADADLVMDITGQNITITAGGSAGQPLWVSSRPVSESTREKGSAEVQTVASLVVKRLQELVASR